MTDAHTPDMNSKKATPTWIWFAFANLIAIIAILLVVIAFTWHRPSGPGDSPDHAPKSGIADAQDSSSLIGVTPDSHREKKSGNGSSRSVAEVISRVEPGVVLISTFDSRGNPVGTGSGFLIDRSGLVATNFHVFQMASSATVEFSSREKIAITGIRSYSQENDLAILQLQSVPEQAVVLTLAEPAKRESGMTVISLGHPDQFKFTSTTGSLSAVHTTADLPPAYQQELSAPPDSLWLQTTAVISGGSSGGPLVDDQGSVIGINTWMTHNFSFAADVGQLIDLTNRAQSDPIPLGQLTGPDEEVSVLMAEFQEKARWYNIELARAKTSEAREELARDRHPALQYASRLCEIAEAYPQSPASFQCLQYACRIAAQPGAPEACHASVGRAAEQILARYSNDQRLSALVWSLRGSSIDPVCDFLRRLTHESSNRAIRGTALFCLGESLSLREELQSNDEAVAVMEQVVNEYPDAVYHCPHPEHPLHRLVEEAKESVFVLKHLSVGRQAPEIVGNGRDGTEFKLSDFRGKIVVLDFWADWCPPCRQMVPHEKQLALDLKDKPFALIGVYCDESRALEKFIAKESINWVNWIDGKTGPISEHWRIQAFPTLFVLDRSGVIRHRHVGVVDPETLRGWVENLLAD